MAGVHGSHEIDGLDNSVGLGVVILEQSDGYKHRSRKFVTLFSYQ